MKPIDKAREVFDKNLYNTPLVVRELSERYPQIFLELAEKHKVERAATGYETRYLNEADMVEIDASLSKGNNVGALKLIRKVTGAGLKEAKAFLDKYRGKA